MTYDHGPNTDPFGTSMDSGDASDVSRPTATTWVQSSKLETNQARTSKHRWGTSAMIRRSIESKATYIELDEHPSSIRNRLEIGRYEFESVRSIDGFLRRGCMTAIFCLAGRVHYSNDMHVHAITSHTTSSTLFSNHVGTGSRMQCSAGALPDDRFTSAVTGLNAARDSTRSSS